MSTSLPGLTETKDIKIPVEEISHRRWASAVPAAAPWQASHHLIARAVLLGGLSVWTSIAVINNSTDFATNSFFLSQMTSMTLIRGDASSGRGLLWRSVDHSWAGPALLCLVVICQVFVALVLWWATTSHLRLLSGRSHDASEAIRAGTLALSAFTGIWLVFMTGGFWFGYWLHMGAFQQVHMTLLIVGIASLAYLASTDAHLSAYHDAPGCRRVDGGSHES